MNSQTLNCVMIALESAPVTPLREALSSSFLFELVQWQKQYPDEIALLRMLRMTGPDLLVIDFSDMQKALRILTIVQQQFSHIEILAVCEENISALSTLLRAGVRDYVTPASTFEDITNTLKSQAEKLFKRPETVKVGVDIVTFLPAKPDSGASTIAANATFAASRIPGKRTLRADFDRNSGVQSFLFKLRSDHTLRDALNSVQEMDGDMWARIRSTVGDMNILPADLDSTTPLDGNRANCLLQFFRRAYDLTCIDLSGQLDTMAIEALLESKRVLIICTQELACQHLLLRKVERLRRAGLDKQMRLIVNRFLPKHVMTPDQISDLVGLPVELSIANNYEAANCPVENGSLIKADTNLGRSYKKLAEIMLDSRIEIPKTKHTFLEYIAQPFFRCSTEWT